MPDNAKIPQNQQDALPLLSISDATQPDTVSSVGGQLIKFWGPASMGINAAPRVVDPLGGGSSYFSNFLDVRGCSNFQVVFLIATGGAGGDDGASFDLFVQYRSGGVSPRSGVGAGLGTFLFGAFQPGSPLVTPGTIAAAAGTSMVCTKGMALSNNGSSVGVSWVGTDGRLWVRYGGAANANYLLSASVWATGP